ncbi:MAG: multiheme c-type cytochrome [Pirellulales bacterium]
MTESVESAKVKTAKPKQRKAIGPRLRKVLYLVFALVALLVANSGYLASVTSLEWFTGKTYQNYFYQYMFLGHLILGLLFIVPYLIFGIVHLLNTKDRKQRRAVKIGYALFTAGIIVLVSGLLLTRIGGFDLKRPLARSTIYWLHIAVPVIAAWLYFLHRLSGPKIKWKLGAIYGSAVAVSIVVMMWLHGEDPRKWNSVGPESGAQYFAPSLARTTTGDFIPDHALMNDQYCQKCHQDVHAAWHDSVHHFSSFNNPVYLASVNETREVALKRDGSMQATRWCAGCHDPVPFFSGAFDNPNFDMLKDPTGSAGVTCTTCHAITHINSTRGNADYTIEEPLHYPFAYSENPILQWVNHQLVKAKPSFHKKTFLKPLHKTAEFCSACHKVHLPKEVTNYRDFLRGQNHYDSYLVSGVSGIGARSFYYPPKSQANCNGCHMPLVPSNDFGAQYFDGATELSVHDHLFPSANTGMAWLRDKDNVVKAHQRFLEDMLRVDIFGIREGGEIDSPLVAPLRPEVPTLKPGKTYLLETVIRTLALGHHFTQGTVDSNQIWLEITVRAGDKIIGKSGGVDDHDLNKVDPWSHMVNVFLLDKNGNRINRRNPQDIFTALYNHQIPPGAGQTVHYELFLPEEINAPITVELSLNYRKFDQQLMDFIAKKNHEIGNTIRGHVPGKDYVNQLPITVLATDKITFPVEGVTAEVDNPTPKFDTWKRWNDYGIGLLLNGKAQFRQAADAFKEVEKLNRWDGPMNLTRVYNAEGRIDDAVSALKRAEKFNQEKHFPSWTWAWLSGVVNRQQGNLPDAVQNLRSVLELRTPDMIERDFNFSKDYKVLNLLGQSLFDLGSIKARQGKEAEAQTYWNEALEEFKKAIAVDSENVTAHYNLQRTYSALGNQAEADRHAKLHQRYKSDDTAQSEAVRLAREKYPAANYAAGGIVKYKLHRPNAPGLPEEVERSDDPQ